MFRTPTASRSGAGTYFHPTPRAKKRQARPSSTPARVQRVFFRQDRRASSRTARADGRLSRRRGRRQVVTPRARSRTIARQSEVRRMIDPVHGGMRGAPKICRILDAGVSLARRPAPQRLGASSAPSSSFARAHVRGRVSIISAGASPATPSRALAHRFREDAVRQTPVARIALAPRLAAPGMILFPDPRARDVALRAREKTTADGAFSASLAPSPKAEDGKFYVGSLPEITHYLSVLGQRTPRSSAHYDLERCRINFDGPHHPQSPQACLRAASMTSRTRNAGVRSCWGSRDTIRPWLDDKRCWPGLELPSIAGPRSNAGVAFYDRLDQDGVLRAFLFIAGNWRTAPPRPFLARGQAASSRPRLRSCRHDPRFTGAHSEATGEHDYLRTRAGLAGALSPPLHQSREPAVIPRPRRTEPVGAPPAPRPTMPRPLFRSECVWAAQTSSARGPSHVSIPGAKQADRLFDGIVAAPGRISSSRISPRAQPHSTCVCARPAIVVTWVRRRRAYASPRCRPPSFLSSTACCCAPPPPARVASRATGK